MNVLASCNSFVSFWNSIRCVLRYLFINSVNKLVILTKDIFVRTCFTISGVWSTRGDAPAGARGERGDAGTSTILQQLLARLTPFNRSINVSNANFLNPWANRTALRW